MGMVMLCNIARSTGSELGSGSGSVDVTLSALSCRLDACRTLTQASAHVGLSPINVGRMLMRGVLPTYSPCPALACIELLKRSDIPIHNKKVGVVTPVSIAVWCVTNVATMMIWV